MTRCESAAPGDVAGVVPAVGVVSRGGTPSKNRVSALWRDVALQPHAGSTATPMIRAAVRTVMAFPTSRRRVLLRFFLPPLLDLTHQLVVAGIGLPLLVTVRQDAHRIGTELTRNEDEVLRLEPGLEKVAK